MKQFGGNEKSLVAGADRRKPGAQVHERCDQAVNRRPPAQSHIEPSPARFPVGQGFRDSLLGIFGQLAVRVEEQDNVAAGETRPEIHLRGAARPAAQ